MATCLLDNGETIEYHAAARVGRRPYPREYFKYAGDGVIDSVTIKGRTVYYKSDTRLSFFVLRR